VEVSSRFSIVAAGAAVLLVSGMALANVAAPTSPPAGAPGAAAVAAATLAQEQAEAEAARKQAALDPKAVNCMAKVVHHEAGNQPRKGQIAVAHVLVNRVKRGFGDHVCDVANQRGQFFRLSRYKPNRNSSQWAEAVDVARAVLAGAEPDHSKGALYFHATWKQPNSFFRSRTKVTRLKDHEFYR
jgi:N-acetylmuramoyl-L-alanine amidase